MEPFKTFTGIVAPLNRANVDTDLIIPKQFLKSIERTGFGPNLFDSMRYQDEGQPGADNSKRPLKLDFVLNQDRYKEASILLAGANFGCGSSREHAPWALLDYGFRALIAPSFADIFENNCYKNGILPIILPEVQVQELFAEAEATQGFSLTINLIEECIGKANGEKLTFSISPFRKHCLLEGLDDIAQTLARKEAIQVYEQRQNEITPWLFQ